MVSRLDEIKEMPPAERKNYYSTFDFNLLDNSYIKFTIYNSYFSHGEEYARNIYCYINKVTEVFSPDYAIKFIGYGYDQNIFPDNGNIQYFDGERYIRMYTDSNSFTDIEFISEEEFVEELNQTSLVKFVKKKIEEGIL